VRLFVAVGSVVLLCGHAQAQHLWWNLEGQREATCLYGEITVLATHPGIYYCGANWHPGEPAGGYCGIQHNSEKERRTIFSIWDTSPTLRPRVTQADPQTVFNRFGGEGTGSHTHMVWPWKLAETFQFFVQKQPGSDPGTTDTRYYFYDRGREKWLHSATIASPHGGKQSVATIGGGLSSFLENFTGKDCAAPKLALYRLWLGPGTGKMKCLTRAAGDGNWGKLHNAYFLAEGDARELAAVFSTLESKHGKPVADKQGEKLDPLPDTPVPDNVVEALKRLPHARKMKQ